jgi:hypothetical protein
MKFCKLNLGIKNKIKSNILILIREIISSGDFAEKPGDGRLLLHQYFFVILNVVKHLLRHAYRRSDSLRRLFATS